MTARGAGTPAPPQPFDPEILALDAGDQFYRVHAQKYGATEFNPNGGSGGRFHFFGDPYVPVLYIAETRIAAVAETLLHDLPVGKPSRLRRSKYEVTLLSKIEVRRPLRLAAFLGTGLRRLGVRSNQLTDTATRRYPQTRPWAESAHRAGLDGVVWMSRQCDSHRAYVLFGDRVSPEDLAEVDDGDKLAFGTAPGRDWLVQTCAPLHIDIAP